MILKNHRKEASKTQMLKKTRGQPWVFGLTLVLLCASSIVSATPSKSEVRQLAETLDRFLC